MKRIIIAGLIAAGILTAPHANADPWCSNPYTCNQQPSPIYQGPLLPTWDQPGYPGWNGGQTMCDPISQTCRGAVPNPNGGPGW